MSGYAHPAYAWSLQEFGCPRELPRCGGWVLERQVPGTSERDATGCYPLFACADWGRLREDLDAIGGSLLTQTPDTRIAGVIMLVVASLVVVLHMARDLRR